MTLSGMSLTRARLPLIAWCIATLATGCATNPAKNLEPNDVDVKVNDDETPQGLFRGDEALDEQDFYHLTGDVESEKAVNDSRSTGTTMQIAGVSLIAVGIATVAFVVGSLAFAPGGLAGEQGLVPQIWQADMPFIPYLIGAAGAGAIGGGSYLFGDGKAKTLGITPIFDLEHAQASIENGRYGPGGLKPENIASLSLKTADDKLTYCGSSGTVLAPITAKDSNSKIIKISHHLDWLTWKTEPTGVLTDGDVPLSDDQATAEPVRAIKSPLRSSLSNLGKPVVVTAAVTATGVNTVLTLQQDLSCFETIDLHGDPGEYGRPGNDGRFGSQGAPGGDGTPGANGGDGQAGSDVEAEASWVVDSKGRQLALVVWTEGSSTRATVLDPRGNVRITADGGRGGRGGQGGRGGNGASSDSGKTPRYCAGRGGSGGSGGTGGRGGSGGRVTLRLSDESLSAVVRATANGGSGGSAGSGGYKGSGGSNNSACGGRFATSGTSGTDGTDGTAGQPGQVNKRTVSASELRLIADVLAKTPGLKLVAGAGASLPTPPPPAPNDEPITAPAAAKTTPAVPDEPMATPAPEEAPAADAPKFKLAKSKFKKNEKIVVTFDRALVAPAGQQYWITIIDPSEPDTAYGTWHYVPANAKKDTVVATRPGTYEIRLNDLYPRFSGKVLSRTKVVVK